MLQVAAHRGHEEVVVLLLASGAPPGADDLMAALRRRRWSIAERLFAAGNTLALPLVRVRVE